MNYLHSYHTVTDTGKNQRAKFLNFCNLTYLTLKIDYSRPRPNNRRNQDPPA